MSNNGPTSKTSQEKPESGILRVLRALALIAVWAGAAGSVGLTLRAGTDSPRLLLIIFVFWVLSPFAGLLWANLVSKRWSAVTRVTLFCVTLIIMLSSLATYGEYINVKPAGAANAFLYVIVPPISWVFMAIIVSFAAFISNKLSRR